MKKMKMTSKYSKFLVYLVAVVLLNVVGVTLFARLDLTANRVYSLSEVSRQVVGTLSEPLTVKVFFSRNLPAPHNSTERYLRDLLAEYDVAANRYFNFQFFDVSNEDNDTARRNRELAESYNIHPIQIQNFEQDEVKFQKAYMGMVIIHGDVVETLAAITSTDGLEYRITSTIRKMNDKISALLNLKDPVEVSLILSSSLNVVGPYMNLPALADLPQQVEGIVEKLNRKNYDRLSFRFLDPSRDPKAGESAEAAELMKLQWKAFQDPNGKSIPAGEGFAGVEISYGEKREVFPLIRAIRLPIFGTQYQSLGREELERAISDALESLIDINPSIGYLAGHGTPPLVGGFPPGQGGGDSLNNFNTLLSQNYTVRPISLDGNAVPEGIECLLIAGPKEKFSDWELYQIDQFLMQGKSLAVFMDPFQEIAPGGRNRMMGGGPVHKPLDTGLEKLLHHYGLTVKKSLLMDENCYEQTLPRQFGGGKRPIYFAPIIQGENINGDLKFMQNIKGLVLFKAAPLAVAEERIQDQGLEVHRLLSSSDKSWEMSGQINLNPMFIQPPAEGGQKERRPLAYLVSGPFKSYFAGQPIPEKPEEKTPPPAEGEEKPAPAETEARKPAVDPATFQAAGATRNVGRPGRIFLIGTSEILTDSILDEEGQAPNAQFVLNLIDYLNDREPYAVMRSKSQRFNPLRPLAPATRTLVKTLNITGLPVLVVLAGLGIWMRRASKKRWIQKMYSE